MAGTVRNRNRSRSRRSARSTQSRRRKIVGGMNLKHIVAGTIIALSGQIDARGVPYQKYTDREILDTLKKEYDITGRIEGNDVIIADKTEQQKFAQKWNDNPLTKFKIKISSDGKVIFKHSPRIEEILAYFEELQQRLK